MSVLGKLLKYLPQSVFSHSPDPVIAIRIRASNSLSWSINSKVLTVTANSQIYNYSLVDKTVSELASELSGSGITIEYLNMDQADRGAICLLDGSGDQDKTNGDHLLAYQNLAWALFGAYAEELVGAKIQAAEAIKQMVIPTSEVEWLDLWGKIYGVPRRNGETDSVFAPRIPIEVFRQRVNPRAIELAIRDLTGKDVRIEEPWENIARWDESILDGPDKFYDGEFIGYHLIQPVSQDYVNWDEIMPIVHRNRPTGVLVLHPTTKYLFDVDAIGHEVLFGRVSTKCAETPYEDKLLWDYSEFGDTAIPNRSSRNIKDKINYSQSIWDDGNYSFVLFNIRDFRVFYSALTYMRQTWETEKTWKTANATWKNFNEVGPTSIESPLTNVYKSNIYVSGYEVSFRVESKLCAETSYVSAISSGVSSLITSESAYTGEILSSSLFSTKYTETQYSGNSISSLHDRQELRVTTLAGFPHEIDIYKPTGATKAVVFLHGGGGQNHAVAYQLGLNSANANPSVSTVNWSWLQANKTIMIFPQGQTASGNAYTWSNRVMTSGQDDVAFLQALAAYIKTTFPFIVEVDIAGHSNGGMMVNRMWYESPGTFRSHVSFSGPASKYYYDNVVTPSVFKPYFSVIGELDNILRVTNNWDATLWTQNPAFNTPSTIETRWHGEWRNYVAKMGAAIAVTPVDGDKVVVGSIETWTNAGGKYKLKHVLNGGHSIASADPNGAPSLQVAMGVNLIDLMTEFIDAQQ